MNAYDNALRQLETAARTMNLSTETLTRLSSPERIVQTSLPIKMDDGTTRVFQAYRVQYSSARGPYKGGIRFHPQVDLDEVKALGFWMAIKTAVVAIPMGGGKGGIIVDPKSLSQAETERLTRAWTRSFREVIGPDKDIPAPDVYTTPQIMAWIADEYSQLVGHQSWGVVTGKPVAMGGSLGRNVATATGGFYVLTEALKDFNLEVEDLAVAIQGFGNAGSVMARVLANNGAKIVALADSQAIIYNAKGLDISAVEEYKKENKSLAGFPGSNTISKEEFFALQVEVIIPAALENQITAEIANSIQAKIVLELANGPTTPEADEILAKKNIMLIPDVLANAGGVTVSYFEWLQNLSNDYWTAEEVDRELREKMIPAWQGVKEAAEKYQVTLRQGAFIKALERIDQALQARK